MVHKYLEALGNSGFIFQIRQLTLIYFTDNIQGV